MAKPTPLTAAELKRHPLPSVESGDESTSFDGGERGWNPRVLGERRRPTTAEQAVPWLIGMVLALWGREQLAEDSVVKDSGGWGGVTLA